MRTLAIGFVLVLFAAPAMAQTGVDPRWNGWLGCWSLVTEDERSDGPAPVAAAIDRVRGFGPASEPATEDPDRPRLCVAANGQGGVTLTTQSGDTVVFEQTIVADGIERPVDGTCSGTRQSEWSQNGRLLFSRAELTCEDGAAHSGSSVSLLTRDGAWLDVEAVRSGTQEGLVVRRYRRLDSAAPPASLAGAGFTLANVQEAAARVPPAAVEAALVESQATFDLNARRVVALADAGVPDRVIDMVVALSYPQQFVVERDVPPLQASNVVDPFSPTYDPWRDGDLWRYGYAPFGYWSPFYISASDLVYERFYPAIPGVIVVNGGGATNTIPPPPGVASRAINDLGYTRARARDPEPSTAVPRTRGRNDGFVSSGSSRTTASRSGDSGGGSDSGGGGGGGGGSSVSPRGYSGGGGGGSGRTAVPR